MQMHWGHDGFVESGEELLNGGRIGVVGGD